MPEADATMVREFEREGLDFKLRGEQFGIARNESLFDFFDACRHPVSQVLWGIKTGQFSIKIHA